MLSEFSALLHMALFFLEVLVAASNNIYNSKLHVPIGRKSTDTLYGLL